MNHPNPEEPSQPVSHEYSDQYVGQLEKDTYFFLGMGGLLVAATTNSFFESIHASNAFEVGRGAMLAVGTAFCVTGIQKAVERFRIWHNTRS